MKKYSYKYFQLELDHPRKFRNLNGSFFGASDDLEYTVNLLDYTMVYQGEIEATEEPIDALNRIFTMFNVNRPADFKMHSMSVSDLVELNGEYYSCETMGWKKVNRE